MDGDEQSPPRIQNTGRYWNCKKYFSSSVNAKNRRLKMGVNKMVNDQTDTGYCKEILFSLVICLARLF